MTNVVEAKVNQLVEFFDEWAKFLSKCDKPTKKQYLRMAQSCAMGILIMGVIGYLIKLLFIPINTILLSK
jgi:protein transport protein SEC61 subunit gamma-like protein